MSLIALNMVFHGKLLLSLLTSNLFVCLLSSGKLSADLLSSGEVSLLKPWMGNDIRNGETGVRMEAEHGSDQILEVLSEESVRFAVLMSCPELLASVCGNELVVRVIKSGAFERRVSSIEDEQNDSKSEKINDLALIRLLSVDFGSHEAKRSDV